MQGRHHTFLAIAAETLHLWILPSAQELAVGRVVEQADDRAARGAGGRVERGQVADAHVAEVILDEMRRAATGRLRVQMMAIEGASGISRPTEEELSSMTAADRKKALSRQKRIDALTAALAPGRPDDRLLIKALYQFQEEGSSWATLAAGYKQALEQARKAENAVLKPIGMTLDSFDMETAKSAARGREAEQEARLAEYKSDAFLWRLWEEASERKSAMAIDGKEVADRVEEFKRYNHLLGYLAGSNPAGSCQVPRPEDDDDGEGMLMLANAMAMRLRLMNARNAS